VDIVLDKAGGDSSPRHFGSNLPADPGHPEHPVATVAAAGVVREGHRRLDVVLLGVCLPLADGVRGGQQLYGTGGHQGHEGLLGREHQ